mgnify:CR=1 FL=1
MITASPHRRIQVGGVRSATGRISFGFCRLRLRVSCGDVDICDFISEHFS